MSDVERLSAGWRYAVIGTFAFGFAVLILLTFAAYQNAPPIPQRPSICRHRRIYRK
jgi:nitric oxide reductase large subunit